MFRRLNGVTVYDKDDVDAKVDPLISNITIAINKADAVNELAREAKAAGDAAEAKADDAQQRMTITEANVTTINGSLAAVSTAAALADQKADEANVLAVACGLSVYANESLLPNDPYIASTGFAITLDTLTLWQSNKTSRAIGWTAIGKLSPL